MYLICPIVLNFHPGSKLRMLLNWTQPQPLADKRKQQGATAATVVAMIVCRRLQASLQDAATTNHLLVFLSVSHQQQPSLTKYCRAAGTRCSNSCHLEHGSITITMPTVKFFFTVSITVSKSCKISKLKVNSGKSVNGINISQPDDLLNFSCLCLKWQF